MRIGIDVGGTFTDVVLVDKQGNFSRLKTPTTHYDLAKGVLTGLGEILQLTGKPASELNYLIHGTTIGTNAICEGKGAKAGLITTRGFEDVLEIRRVARPKEAIYDFEVDNPPPLIPHYLRKGIIGRVNSKGEVTVPLDENSVYEVVDFFKSEGVNAIVISFLFSFLNPSHEQRVAQICRERFPEALISLSSEVCPEFREYERTCTTVMNGYLGPVIHRYMDDLAKRLEEKYGEVELHIMTSNGGSMPVQVAKDYAANLINSGPSGGALATGFITKLMGRRLAMGVDMGGTSFDITIIDGGIPKTTTWGGVIEYPIKLPMIDTRSIGAGGGSIARVDEFGVLHVGPDSAGSDPGPVCYNWGGADPAVTDANLILRRVNPDYFNGGKQKLYPELAREAIKKHIADKMGVSVEEAALSIVKVINANMVKGMSGVSVERGYDLREFALVAFGAACALHACEMAREVHIPEVIIPSLGGLYSAVGLVVADVMHDYVKTVSKRQDKIEPEELLTVFKSLDEQGIRQLKEDRVNAKDMEFQWSADVRYDGQSWELNIPIARASKFGAREMKKIEKTFHEAHYRAYSYSNPGEKLEFVNLRTRAIGKNPELTLPRYPVAPTPLSKALKEKRKVWLQSGPAEIPIYERDLLGVGTSVSGPCVVEQDINTIFIPSGDKATVDEFQNFVVSIGED